MKLAEISIEIDALENKNTKIFMDTKTIRVNATPFIKNHRLLIEVYYYQKISLNTLV